MKEFRTYFKTDRRFNSGDFLLPVLILIFVSGKGILYFFKF